MSQEPRQPEVASATHGLRRELRLRDLVPMQIVLVVGVNWSAIAAREGSTHPLIWIFGILLFFLPQVWVVTWCARVWPLEGGVYQWTRAAIGPMAGFLSAWNYALYAIFTVSQLGIQTITSLSYAFGPRAAWLAGSRGWTIALDLLLLGAVLGINAVGFHYGKWVGHFGTLMMLVLTCIFVLLLFWHPTATTLHPHHSPQPPFALGWTVWSLLTLNLYTRVAFNAYSGMEQIAVFAGETRQAGRAIVLSAWVAAPAIAAIYFLMTSSMLTYVPAAQIDLAGSIPQALAAAFGQGTGAWLGRVMILALATFTFCSFTTITAETSRLPMVAGWDRLLPEWFTRLNPRFGTPVRSVVVIVVVALVAALAATLTSGHEEAFQVLISSGQLLFGLYYCAMFAVPLLAGPRRNLPRASLWIRLCAMCGLVITLVATVLALAPIIDVSNSWLFTAKVGGATLLLNLIGVLIYRSSRRMQSAPINRGMESGG